MQSSMTQGFWCNVAASNDCSVVDLAVSAGACEITKCKFIRNGKGETNKNARSLSE